ATNAPPEEIRRVFGHRRTMPIGAAFGVISVLGPAGVGHVEVATFREDSRSSDGRRPDSVRFSTAEMDSQRRDFTINGMFLDPFTEQLFDWVGGQQDLENKLLRAIGNPYQRFEEDKLRMLRAVRFTSTYGFELEPDTESAIRAQATELRVVSAERIGGELSRILEHPTRRRGMELLDRCGLLPLILPELAALRGTGDPSLPWQLTLQLLDTWRQPVQLELALGALLVWLPEQVGRPEQNVAAVVGCAERIGERLRLPRRCSQTAEWLTQSLRILQTSTDATWPQVQRCLADPRGDLLMKLADPVARITGVGVDALRYCQRRMAESDWNPLPLITGDDLKKLGIPSGPQFGYLLAVVRDAQLRREVDSKEKALAFVCSLWPGDTPAT
ncbi:MAG: CCA tRNA nucleotidyltransferase, partial [Planctomycetota bacterium]|nr:CCA tRNA nucleotidyltransferase [Planctomycetota bacterium]